eukprot:TRINITY_DN9602_c0_g1_i1.p1 TRINITY_DN9602_c0_g1~~TRINITY_DN9602_c0_g1_i1.p1  ORF type:complete len:811 (-),score=201.60 TRINITY_DN9602_c0_g1_i1:15-2447(-)
MTSFSTGGGFWQDLDNSDEIDESLIRPGSPTSGIGPTSDLSSPVDYHPRSSLTSGFFQTSPSTTPSHSPKRENDEDRPLVGPNIGLVCAEKALIWGTNVSVKETIEAFRIFVEEFKENPEASPFYPLVLQQMAATDTNSLNLDAQHLYAHSPSLYSKMILYPTDVLPLFEQVVQEMLINMGMAFGEEIVVQIRPFNLVKVSQLRLLNPDDIDQLVTIRGMVIRTSPIIPELKEAFFRCSICQWDEMIGVEKGGKFNQPTQCPTCKANQSMMIQHNRCVFEDKQWVKLQENPENIPEGMTPYTVGMYVYRELVDVPKPGDRIQVTGIYRAQPLRVNSFQRTVKSVFKTFVDVIHLKKSEKHRVGVEETYDASQTYSEKAEPDTFMKEQEEKLWALSQSPDIYEKLTRSLAPNIWELDDVKKGILCQLFGGTNKAFDENGIGKFRGEINILLCGDPGTSKSQLMQYVHKLAPRGIYTSGKGSSAVGLTAYVTKDPETKESVLESGALVLSDRGICCIDEFDKMSDQTRSVLHEAMEQQTVSIAKAGIICTLNSRTSVLACANPRESRYNPRLSVVDNIMLPPTLLSRFDLIYLVLDKPEERTDRKLAAHLVALYFKEEDRPRQEFLDSTTFTNYISYAKKTIHPQLSEEAVADLVAGYVEMRKLGGAKKTITATPRQLEALIRLSEALARMRFSKVVERIDVAEAQRLVRSALQQAATDPRTGTLDVDLITTGRSATSRGRLTELMEEIKRILSGRPTGMKMDQLHRNLTEGSSVEISTSELRDSLKILEDEEVLSLGGDVRNPMIHPRLGA